MSNKCICGDCPLQFKVGVKFDCRHCLDDEEGDNGLTKEEEDEIIGDGEYHRKVVED